MLGDGWDGSSELCEEQKGRMEESWKRDGRMVKYCCNDSWSGMGEGSNFGKNHAPNQRVERSRQGDMDDGMRDG